MKIIGLTGRSGSGKTMVSNLLAQYNAYVIDCDKLAHDLLDFNSGAIHELKEVFGSDIMAENNRSIDRRKLSAIVFDNSDLLKKLTEISHRYIIAEILEIIEKIKINPGDYQYIVIDAPLLIEANLQNICDSVWVVYAEEGLMIRRIMNRDGITLEQAHKRLASQMPFENLRQYADVLIKNEGNMDELKIKIRENLSLL